MPTTIDNSQADSSAGTVGEAGSQYFAQTFDATGTTLNNITLTSVNSESSGDTQFRLLVTTVDLNESGFNPGQVLFESPTQTVPAGTSSPVSVDTSGIALTPGTQYAFVLDSFVTRDGVRDEASIGTNSAYQDGRFYYSNNAASRDSAFAEDFKGFFDTDIAFTATFDSVVCFTTSTRILTARGEIAVEDLHVGDMAVTASDMHRPIRWIGSRTVDCARHPRPSEVMPVRIAAGALGEHRPARDLVVSPGHSLCLDVLGEVLIPAAALVNGTTITQQDVDSVTYWHVELDSHDILIAEGQPAESYLDMGNRGFFAESGVVALGATPDADAAARTHADFCRPYVDGGVVLDAVRAQIQARAERLGWRLDDAPWAGMHLMVDGVRVEADTHGLSARFVLPAAAQDVWLVSETSAPSQISNNRDPRQLGLCIQGITIDDGVGEKRSVALDDPLLSRGFHDCEDGVRRWTAGRSELPAALFDGCRGTVFLRFDLAAPALPRWIAPQADEAALSETVVTLAA